MLTAIAGGFRELLASRGEPTDRVVRTLVPVSVRSPEEHGEYNNRVSAIFADLPVGIEDPVERLAAVHRQMERLKRSHEAVAGDVLVGLSGFAPAMLLALGLRTATQVPQRNVNTVTTNVPGPQRPLYAAGRRMLECFPYVPLAGHVRVGVAIFSYDGGARLRRHGRLRPGARHRRPLQGDRALDGRAGRGRRRTRGRAAGKQTDTRVSRIDIRLARSLSLPACSARSARFHGRVARTAC